MTPLCRLHLQLARFAPSVKAQRLVLGSTGRRHFFDVLNMLTPSKYSGKKAAAIGEGLFQRCKEVLFPVESFLFL